MPLTPEETKETATALSGLMKPELERMVDAKVKRMDDERAERKESVRKRTMDETYANMGQMVRALHARKESGDDAMRGALKDANSQLCRSLSDDVRRTLQLSDFTKGGALIQPELADAVIEYLRPDSVTDQLQVQRISFSHQLDMGRISGGVVVQWIDEGATTTPQDISTDRVILRARKIQVLAKVSNDMIRAGKDGETGRDMMRAVAQAFDDVALTGTGVAGQPRGLYKQPTMTPITGTKPTTGLGVQTYAATGNTSPLYVADVDKAKEYLFRAYIPRDTSRAFLIDPTQERILMGLVQGTNGAWTFRDEMTRGTLAGQRFVVANQAAAGAITFGAWSQMVIGVDTSMTMSIHADTYANTDETLIRMIMSGDVALRHPEAFTNCTGHSTT